MSVNLGIVLNDFMASVIWLLWFSYVFFFEIGVLFGGGTEERVFSEEGGPTARNQLCCIGRLAWAGALLTALGLNTIVLGWGVRMVLGWLLTKGS